MLNILFQEDEREIRYTDSYFNNNFQDEWMEDDLVKQMIRDIDASEVVTPQIYGDTRRHRMKPPDLNISVTGLVTV